MWVRRFWLAGLVALAAANLAAAQDNSTAVTAEGGEEKKEEEPEVETKPPLTGNPQIDYKYDPNLPHEVIGYDLSDYPFYSKLPKDLLDPKFNFSCDNRHDGFYASVPHKCQVYHNCLFGVRYDFLCANYTVFDQKNFICHYVSEVDCVNSEKHFDRNEALYVTTTSSTTPRPTPKVIYLTYDDNFDDYPYTYDEDYRIHYITERTTTTTTSTTQRPRRRPTGGPKGGEGANSSGGGGWPLIQRCRKRPRVKRSMSQNNEDRAPRTPREKNFDNVQGEAPQVLPQQTRRRGRLRRRGFCRPNPGGRRKTTTTTTTTTEASPDYDDDYYYYYYDDYYNSDGKSTTTTTTAAPPGRRSRPRNRPGSKGQRARQGRPETEAPITTTTTTQAPPADEQPSGSRARITSRVSTRRNPVVISRRVAQATAPEELPRVGRPIPKRQGSGQRPSERRRARPRVTAPDYYDY